MVRSSLVKSACVAIALSALSAPPAGAIEMVEGAGPAAGLNDGLISKVVVVHRGATAVGPRGGVYHRGGTWAVVRAMAAAASTTAAGSIAAEPAWLSPRSLRLSWRSLSRRLRRLGAARIWLGSRRRDRGRRGARRSRHRRGHRLCRPAAGPGPVLVLHRSELPPGLLGRLPVSAELARRRPFSPCGRRCRRRRRMRGSAQEGALGARPLTPNPSPARGEGGRNGSRLLSGLGGSAGREEPARVRAPAPLLPLREKVAPKATDEGSAARRPQPPTPLPQGERGVAVTFRPR